MNTRMERRVRKVPHTVDGETALVDEDYYVSVPALPTDWDHHVAQGARVATIIAFCISIVWTAASIGDLLAGAVLTPIAYGTAVLFDIGWIYCSAMEWLARHHPKRARLPKRASYVFLAVAMAAVAAHGYLTASVAVGAIGAFVSLIAKGMWIIYMRQQAAPLDPRTQQVIDQRDTQERARKALAQIHRSSRRVSEELAAYTAVQLAERAPHITVTSADTTPSHDVNAHSHEGPHGSPHSGQPQVTGMGAPLPHHPHTVPTALPPAIGSISKAEAVRTVAATLHPSAGPAEIARFLSGRGIEVRASYVSNVLGRDKKKQTAPPVLPALPDDNGGYL